MDYLIPRYIITYLLNFVNIHSGPETDVMGGRGIAVKCIVNIFPMVGQPLVVE